MSDYSITLVPILSAYPDKENKVKEILKWLVAGDIVKSILTTCVLSNATGYAISDGARAVINSSDWIVFNLAVNGLEVIMQRQVFDTGGNGVEKLICPTCEQDISAEDWSFIGHWYDGETDNVTCPVCDVTANIHQFQFVPGWGFSDLGFKFWNWPDLTPEFISQFQRKLGCGISVVYQHV